MDPLHEHYLEEALRLARQGMERNEGGPFGAIVVKDGQVIGRGNNCVTSRKDPSAHAEIVAIRDACRHLNDFQLRGCVLYTSCEPCPMCLGAIYWARPDAVYFAGTRADAAAAGFDDDFIYRQLETGFSERSIPFFSMMREKAQQIFRDWIEKPDKIAY